MGNPDRLYTVEVLIQGKWEHLRMRAQEVRQFAEDMTVVEQWFGRQSRVVEWIRANDAGDER